jgi:hypothetical protein
MATSSVTPRATQPVTAPAIVVKRPAARRRRISPQAGRALEILGHAIEYLADEYVHQGPSRPAGQLDAIQLLIKIDREIYLECPEVLTIADRWRSLVSRRNA